MSKYKPYSLSVKYQENPQPSALTQPYDLHAEYDESATWGIDYISADGFGAQEFGAHQVTYTQNIQVNGFNDIAFGQSELKNLNQFISTQGISELGFGSVVIINKDKWISLSGFDAQGFGSNTVYNLRKYISLNNQGFDTASSGTQNVWNFNKEINPTGFDAQVFSSTSNVYNLRQYVSLTNNGFDTQEFGPPYLQGGVKYVNPTGFNASALVSPSVVNTKADQYLNLSNKGIASLAISNPVVSPRFIYISAIFDAKYGSPTVYLKTRYLAAKGKNAQAFGAQWISHSPRYLELNGLDSFDTGYPKIYDSTQKIYVTGENTVISGGVFGDIKLRNTRRIIDVAGIYAQAFGDWSLVESNLKPVIQSGFDAQNFGEQTICNKTPSLAPTGFDALQVALPAIGYWIRAVKPSGFYLPKFGTAILTKPPEIKPNTINQSAIGTLFISNKTRTIFAWLGKDSQVFSEPRVWHYLRSVNPTGIFQSVFGMARVEHGRRALLTQGAIHSAYGNNAWLSYGQRKLSPVSIPYPSMPLHRVGGTQHINPLGYIATLFGTRIVPESQSIYPQGFINPFGLTVVDLWKKYIKPSGFLTTGQEGGHRFGVHKFWNLRQYIVQFYDGDSGLVPPLWSGWTTVENKNKSIGAIGSNLARIGEPNIENKARLFSANGLNALMFGQAMIADRIRKLKLQGLESPYISSWSVIYNATPVIAHRGFKADAFGLGSVVNTRRYFNRIGNFESLAMGTPMVADRIRTLKFEQRYTIAPPYIPIHRIDLHTRYIEEVGRFDDHQLFGNPSLSIHWNIITPRWTLRDAYGTAIIKNLTPELAARGRNSEEFGEPSIRTQWRDLLHLGSETVVWGRSEIAFRDRQFTVGGFTQWVIPRHTVIKTGVPPYYPQYIWLDAVELDGEQNIGHGIKIPERQVSDPAVKSNVIFPEGFVASRYGSHHTQSNGILVQPGLQELTIGNHSVGLKNRNIIAPSLGDSMIVSKPRLSPHTIYAVMEASSQAQTNHGANNLHYVNSSGGTREPGEIFGRTTITLRNRKLSVGLGSQSSFGNGHKVDLKRRYINLKDFGFRSQRIGFHVVGPFDQNIIQFDSNEMQNFGRPTLSIPYGGAFFIKPNGLNSPALNRPIVDFFNRTIKAIGSNHLQMGTRKSGDTPFMWQGLRVGELINGNYGGFENQVFGNTFISLKVRNIEAQGFESFVMEYDYTQFDKRMRVIRQELPKPKLFIKPVGVDALFIAVPNIKPTVHYIRPDGNADQYRKGAF